MAENQNGAEKTELPTPKRVQDAREEGQVAYSSEFTSAVLLLAAFALLAMTGPWFVQAFAATIRHATGPALAGELDHAGTVREMLVQHAPLGLWTLAVILALALIGVATCVAQVGFGVSTKAIMPKWEKLNPVSGFKRLFGLRGLVRLVLSVGKLLALAAIAWLVIEHELPQFVAVPDDLGQRLARDAWLLFLLGMSICAALGVIAGIDVLYQRWQHTRDLMMTRDEVKQEFKQTEGDPLLRSRIRQKQREIAGQRMMQEVPKADVVITNPTHVAVALRYRQGRDAAPVVLAKGYDAQAQEIKRIAAEHGIPMVEDVPLARALAREAALGKAIPVAWYGAVASILASLLKRRTTA